jgi:hypothetical protein
MDNAQVMPDTSILSGDDSLAVVSMRSTDSGGGGYVDQTPSIVQNDSGSQSLASSKAPLSPQRSSHTHNSAARSPASTNIGTPLQMSPIRVTHPTPASAVGAGKPDVSMSNFSVPSLDYTSSMLRGVEQLERQQVEMEARRRHTAVRNSQNIASQNSGSYDDGDEHTEPSSTVTGSTRENPGRGDASEQDPATSTFGRLIQSTRVSDSKIFASLLLTKLRVGS